MQVHPRKSIIINICSVFSHWTVLVLCGPLILLNSSRANAAESGSLWAIAWVSLKLFHIYFKAQHRARAYVFQNFISFSLDSSSRRFHHEFYINNIYNCVFFYRFGREQNNAEDEMRICGLLKQKVVKYRVDLALIWSLGHSLLLFEIH